MSDDARTALLRGAGILLILLAIVAVLLPLVDAIGPREAIGGLLATAGLVELAAAAARWRYRVISAVAGFATLIAGLRLLLDPGAGFFETLNLIILWLVLHSAALAYPAFRHVTSLSTWVALAASVDFLMAIALLAGLPIAILVVGLFGPTRPISATFAWVIGISFIANGARLLATAAYDRREGASGEATVR